MWSLLDDICQDIEVRKRTSCRALSRAFRGAQSGSGISVVGFVALTTRHVPDDIRAMMEAIDGTVEIAEYR